MSSAVREDSTSGGRWAAGTNGVGGPGDALSSAAANSGTIGANRPKFAFTSGKGRP